MREKLDRAMPIIYVTGAVIILGLLILWSQLAFGIGVVCPFNYCFSWDCPGCGVTRMCIAILNGELYQAFRYNCFMFVTGPLVCILYIWQSIIFIWNGKVMKNLGVTLIIYTVALMLFGILRNLESFSWLAPTVI